MSDHSHAGNNKKQQQQQRQQNVSLTKIIVAIDIFIAHRKPYSDNNGLVGAICRSIWTTQMIENSAENSDWMGGKVCKRKMEEFYMQ